jgi:hypothetical protein
MQTRKNEANVLSYNQKCSHQATQFFKKSLHERVKSEYINIFSKSVRKKSPSLKEERHIKEGN